MCEFGGVSSNPLYYAHNLYFGNELVGDLVLSNNVTHISDYAFRNCTSLTSVNIPNSVTYIGMYTFNGCSGLTSVTIGNAVTSIGNDAFNGCSGLTSVTIGNAVTSIGNGAFNGCSGLTSVEIPNSVTSIGNNAFNGCTGLTSVTIPSNVDTLGNYAFEGCTNLTELHVAALTPPTISEKTFRNVSRSIPVYVPIGTSASYRAAEYWSLFNNFVETIYPEQWVEVPYEQTFDGNTIPDKWRSCNGALQGNNSPYTATLTPESGRWHFGAANGVFGGSSHAWVNIGGYYHHFWLVSPFLHLDANANMLSVDLALTRPTGNMVPMTPDAQDNTIIKVLISTDYGATWIPLQSWKHEMGYTDLESLLPEGHTCTYNLSAYANQDILIGFYMECTDANDASNRIHIDNFSITSFDPTLPPTAVTVSEIAGHSAKVNWTPASSVQYKWDVVVALPNTTLQNNLTQAQLEAMAANTNNFFYAHVNGYRYKTMTELEAETSYKAWVRYNDGTVTSPWVASDEFTTDLVCPRPTDINIVDLGYYGVFISWTPGDESQTSWNYFIDGWSDYDSDTDDPYIIIQDDEFGGLTPGGTYTLNLTGYCGEDEQSTTVVHEFTKQALPDLTVNAGVGESDETVPVTGFTTGSQMSRTQFIIPAEQLADMQYSTIKSLTFYNQQYTYGTPWGADARFDIYLKEVSQNDFSNNTFYNWDDMTLVVNGAYLSISGHEMTILLGEAGYSYTGGNLLVGFRQQQYEYTQGTNFDHADWLGVNNYNTNPNYKPSIYYNPSSSGPFAQTFSPKVTFTYDNTYLPPTNLVVTPTAPTEVTLTWTPREGQTGTDVQLYDEDMEPIGTPWTWSNGNVFGLGNLDPSTNYYVSLRGRFTVGNETHYSAWTNPVAFTMPDECPAPTNLQATNVGPFSATLTWEGHAEEYTVEYREVLGEGLTTTFEERFNSISSGSLPSNWIILNSGTTSARWTVINQGNSSNPFANGGKYGSIVSEKQSSATATSYFLMPVDDLHGELTFYAKYQNSAGVGARSIAVYYTNKKINPTVSDLTLVSRRDLTTTFGQYTVDLSAYQGGGYIAIGHINSVSNQAYIVCVDDIEFKNYTTSYSDWQPLGLTTENSMTLEGLTPGATYQFRVRATCDTGFNSDWALSDSFTTVNNIVFEDEEITKGACLYAWDQNGDGNNDGELSYAEAAAVTELGTVFKDQRFMTKFNELKYFTNPDLDTISAKAFAGCVSLQEITLPPQITTIGNYAFGYSTDNQGQIIPCSSLHNIVLPEGVTQIGDYAFCYSGLESIILPFSLTSIGQQAFEHCPLTSVYVPASVNYINNNPFVSESIETIEVDPMNATYESRNACNAIIRKSDNKLISGCKNTVIPNGVLSIGYGAFENATGLTSITLPSSVTTIGEHAFDHCTGLTTIIVESYDPPTIESNAFLNVNTENITVYVPCGSVNTYKNAAGWSSFANIVGDGCATTYSLVAGVWKWWAPFEGNTAADLMEAFDNGIVQGDILVNSQDEGFLRRSGGTWGGTLTSIEPGKMYKILTEASGSFSFTGERPTTVAVELGQGYTWFGFIGNAPVEIRVVLDTTPTDGDKILTEDGHTYTYNEASSLWQSDYGTYISNFTLQTGYGYIYYNASSEPKTLTMQPSY